MPGETMAGVLLFFPSYNQIYLHVGTNICMKYLVVLFFFPLDLVLHLNMPRAQPAWTGCLWLVKTLSCSQYLGCPNADSKALLGTPGV